MARLMNFLNAALATSATLRAKVRDIIAGHLIVFVAHNDKLKHVGHNVLLALAFHKAKSHRRQLMDCSNPT